MPQVIALSVHDVVDVLMRKGHLDTRIFNQASMQEGTRLHALYQKEQGADYLSEYPLEYFFPAGDYIFDVSGKADGVIFAKDGSVTVEEIKTTVADLDEFIRDHGQWHLAQAMVYAYILAKQRNLKQVTIQMTYLRQQDYHMRKIITNVYKFGELDQFISDLFLRYLEYQKKIARFKKERDASVKNLTFPYSDYRPGQKEMMDFVEKACEEKSQVYIEAPTGIGKTLSVLYPVVSRFKDHKADRIFYLTSKNSIKKIAMDALAMFRDQGAKCKAIEFTSKENFCFNDKKGHCNPDECPFARYYYDKLLDAIFDALSTEDCFTRETLSDFCLARQMCPFQFQLDLSQYCDVLVCDYTYVFDYHDRLGLQEENFSQRKMYLLIDECHNLPDRVRDMYSIELEKSAFDDALSYCVGKEFQKVSKDITEAKEALSLIKIDLNDENVRKEGTYILDELPDEFLLALRDFLTDSKEIMKKTPYLIEDGFLDFFYQVNSFFYLAALKDDEEIGEGLLLYARVYKDELFSIKIADLDSRKIISASVKPFSATVFFSATLSPKEYYIDLLGGDINDLNNRLILPSPFPKENRRVFIDTKLSLRYRDRDQTLFPVYNLVRTALMEKKGNYFVFCPSFDYLGKLLSFFQQEPLPETDIYAQGRSMPETEREAFLAHFESGNERRTVGLLVLGGVFSEGIDMKGDRLIGAIIISAGLPQISFERDRLRDYYDKDSPDSQKGFRYAYTYPGINRMLQAGGRVIRSENDVGFLLYIDSRLKGNPYRDIFKDLYPDAINLLSPSQLRAQLRLFWKDKK